MELNRPDCHWRLMYSSNRKFNIPPLWPGSGEFDLQSLPGSGDLTFAWVRWGKLNLKYHVFNFFLRTLKKDEMRRTYTSDSESNLLTYIIGRSTDRPATVALYSADNQRSTCQPLYRPRYRPIVGRYVDHISTDISVEQRSICRPTLNRYVDWYIVRGVHKIHMIHQRSIVAWIELVICNKQILHVKSLISFLFTYF